jgi:polyphosphate kinase 2 (PPK2 family)
MKAPAKASGRALSVAGLGQGRRREVIVLFEGRDAAGKRGTINARINDPLRQWKLSPMDLESYRRWYAYSRARLDAQSDGYEARALAKAQLHFTHPCSNPI